MCEYYGVLCKWGCGNIISTSWKVSLMSLKDFFYFFGNLLAIVYF